MKEEDYIDREIDQRIQDWANGNERALIILGARQVGKTESIRHFLGNHYGIEKWDHDPLPLVDLSPANSAGKEALRQLRTDPGLSLVETVMARENILFEVPEGGILCIDEIQALSDSPKQEASGFVEERIRALLDDPHGYRIIFSGSLLGAKLLEIDRIDQRIPGMHVIRMYPMNLREFTLAIDGGDSHIKELRQCLFQGKELSKPLHIHFLENFARYSYVGGMPVAVSAFLNAKNQQPVAAAYDSVFSLSDLYQDDVVKYFNEQYGVAINPDIFDLLIKGLSENDKKAFMEKNFSLERRKIFEYLIDSDIALLVEHIEEQKKEAPLEDQVSPKAYFLDVGFLRAYIQKRSKLPSSNSATRYYNRKTPDEQLCGFLDWIGGDRRAKPFNNGNFFEQVVAQNLKARGYSFGYSYQPGRPEAGQCERELEFVLAPDNAAIEVKSGDFRDRVSSEEYAKEGKHLYFLTVMPHVMESHDRFYLLPVYAFSFLDPDELSQVIFRKRGSGESDPLAYGRLPQTAGFFPLSDASDN